MMESAAIFAIFFFLCGAMAALLFMMLVVIDGIKRDLRQ